MQKQSFFLALMMIGSISMGMAGTMNNGVWAPSACGTEPLSPVVDLKSVDSYNKSIKDINEWQHKASNYNTCLINEANADNALIAKTANEEQSRFRALVDKIKFDTESAKVALDNKSGK
jgi:hypothetical protein